MTVYIAAGIALALFGDSLGNVGDVELKGRLGERLDAMVGAKRVRPDCHSKLPQ